MTHILKETKKEGAWTVATTNCGETIRSKSRAEVFERCTAWTNLSDCPPCIAMAGG